MKNFGSIVFGFILTLTLFSPSLIAQNLEFELSNKKVALGDLIFLDIKYEGNLDLKPLERKYESESLQVYFIGDSFETQIINFKVTKKHVLKYQVSGKRIGKFSLPKIRVSLDNQVIESGEINIDVTPRNNNPNSQPPGLLDQFFGNQQDEISQVKSPEVVFHTNKRICYVGEPIVGYYVLYSNGYRQPFLERDPNQSISFPFFLSETLNQVTVQIDPSVNRNGIERNTLVYLKEIYGLTPLRVGNYSLGSTNFVVGDGLRFGNVNEIIRVEPGTVQVLALPSGAPKHFSGAIGEYDISFHSPPSKINLGETFYFSIRVFGSGAGIGIDDPLNLKDHNPEKEFYLLKKEKSKVFRKLPEGEFGFYSVVEFFYSFQSKREGFRSFPEPKVSYFSPKKNAFETKTTLIPALKVQPKNIRPKSNNMEKETPTILSKAQYFWVFIGILLFIGGIFTVYTKSKNKQIRENISLLNGKIGSKKGEILKDYLIRHGISENDASSVTELSRAFPTTKWEKIFWYCNKKDKQMLVSLSRTLNK